MKLDHLYQEVFDNDASLRQYTSSRIHHLESKALLIQSLGIYMHYTRTSNADGSAQRT